MNTISRIASGPWPVEEARRLDAVLRVVNEGQEVARSHVPAASGRRRDSEGVEFLQIEVAAGLASGRHRHARRHVRATGRRHITVAERDPFEHVGVLRRAGAAPGRDPEPPFDGCRLRCEARGLVARLVPQMGGNHQVAARHRFLDFHPNADGKRTLEDRQRLVRPDQRGVDGCREDGLEHRNAGRRVNRQRCGDQGRVSRLVGLNMEPIRQSHLQGQPGRAACSDSVGFGQRREVRNGRTELGVGNGCEEAPTTEDSEDTEDRSCAEESAPPCPSC